MIIWIPGWHSLNGAENPLEWRKKSCFLKLNAGDDDDDVRHDEEDNIEIPENYRKICRFWDWSNPNSCALALMQVVLICSVFLPLILTFYILVCG